MEQFKLMFECEDCKKKFPVTQDQAPNSLTHKKEFNSNGQSIFMTYYDCPHCGKRHFVQIDDTNSLQELVRVTNEFKSLMVKRQKGKHISKKQSDKFKKSRQHLSDYRMNLMKEFTGKTATDKETGIEYVLRFSV
jgi:DNA-directed RNA polymerase subunit RPC12/RpoP